MIAEPFLLNEDCSPFIDNDTSATLTAAADLRVLAPPGSIVLNDTNLPADTLTEAQQMTRVRYAFWIMAAVQARRAFKEVLNVIKRPLAQYLWPGFKKNKGNNTSCLIFKAESEVNWPISIGGGALDFIFKM